MNTDDRFLIGILVGVVVLAVAALAIVRLRPAPEYRGEDNPEAVAHDYLLALQREDWSRAHGLLASTLACYPATSEVLLDDLGAEPFQRDFDNVTLSVTGSTSEGDSAIVTVRETRFYTGGLFDSGQSTSDFEVTLDRGAQGWRITRGDRYWPWFWHDPGEQGCDAARRGRPVRR